jgi:hypothetical protein
VNDKIEPPALRAKRLQIEHKAISDTWTDWNGRDQPYGPSEAEIEHSKAISLKRLADIAESWARGAFNFDTLP